LLTQAACRQGEISGLADPESITLQFLQNHLRDCGRAYPATNASQSSQPRNEQNAQDSAIETYNNQR
jgi:hypothetical protein